MVVPPKAHANTRRPTAVVTGGETFVGSNLCERLLAHDVEVIGVQTPPHGQGRLALEKLKHHPHFHTLEVDEGASGLKRIVRADYVFHLLEPHDSKRGQASLATLLAGTHITKHVLELALQHRAKFLLALEAPVSEPLLMPTRLEHHRNATVQETNLYSIGEVYRVAQALTAESQSAKHLNARVVYLADVYGPGMDLFGHDPLPRFLRAIKRGEALVVHGEGLQLLYPTYIADVIEGLLQAMFTAGTNGNVFMLANPASLSEISLSFMLREMVSSRFEIAFDRTKETPRVLSADRLKFATDIGWQPRVDVAEGLHQTLQWLEHVREQALERPLPPHVRVPPSLLRERLRPLQHKTAKPTSSRRQKRGTRIGNLAHTIRLRWSKRVMGIGILLLVVFASLSPVVGVGVNAWAGVRNLRESRTAVEAGDLAQATKSAFASKRAFDRSERQLEYANAIVPGELLDATFTRAEKLIEIGQSLSEGSQHLLAAAEAGEGALKNLLGAQLGDAAALLREVQTETTRAYELLSLTEALLTEPRPKLEGANLFGLGAAYQELTRLVPQVRQSAQIAQSLASVLPASIGADGTKKTYLVLLQNNAELRPTGGFIGSFALLSFQNGKLLDFIIEDVYTADGQLQGHVEPPAALKKHLGEASWYLRDVNWDADFPTTARQAEWFLQKELGRAVDGTVGINLFVVQKLLEAMGEITVSDYQEVIDATNVFERAQYHSEVDFFPGSTQKKDFLSNLARSLYVTMQSLESKTWLKVALALEHAAKERQLTASFIDPAVNGPFATLKWDGGLAGSSLCQDNLNCIADYLAVNEANVGVNKANFFVSRKLDWELVIHKEDDLEGRLTASYTNSSPGETWPGGTYKNYLRLYVPRGSELSGIEVNGERIDHNSVDVTFEHDKTVFGVVVSVPPRGQAQVKVSYRLPFEINLSAQNPTATYTLYFQKQPGTTGDPLSLTLLFPPYLKPVTVPPSLTQTGDLLQGVVDTTTDQAIEVVLTK